MNSLSIADIVPEIQNPYNILWEKYVGYGEEEYNKDRWSNPELQKPDIDYLKGGRYLAPGFPYNIGGNSFEQKDMEWGGVVELDNWEKLAVLNTNHFLVLNGKRYRIANLENGTRILLDGSMYQEKWRTWERHNSTWSFKRLSWEKSELDIWSDESWVWKDVKGQNWYHMHWWNAKFYNGAFGIVEESGHEEILVPLLSWPKNIDRILWITKIYGEERGIEALIWSGNGIPVGIAKVQRDTLKFIQFLTELR